MSWSSMVQDSINKEKKEAEERKALKKETRETEEPKPSIAIIAEGWEGQGKDYTCQECGREFKASVSLDKDIVCHRCTLKRSRYLEVMGKWKPRMHFNESKV